MSMNSARAGLTSKYGRVFCYDAVFVIMDIGYWVRAAAIVIVKNKKLLEMCAVKRDANSAANTENIEDGVTNNLKNSADFESLVEEKLKTFSNLRKHVDLEFGSGLYYNIPTLSSSACMYDSCMIVV